MITAFQASLAAYVDENGELLCPACFRAGDTYARPVSHFDLDEMQTYRAEEFEWHELVDEYDHNECEPGIDCEKCGGTLSPAFHTGHPSEPTNEPVARWAPCLSCAATDGERHADSCPTLTQSVTS